MDIDYLLLLQGVREALPQVVSSFFMLVSDLAHGPALVLLPCLAYWLFDQRRGIAVLMAFTFGSFMNQAVKITVCCARPWMRDPRVVPFEDAIESATGYSFPSGHTQSAASVIGGFGWYNRHVRAWVLPSCTAFVLLVGLSRNFLGVHTPQDVAAALALGIASIWASSYALAWADASRRNLACLSGSLVVFAVLFACYALLKPYPTAGAAAGVDLFEAMDDSMQTVGLMAGAGMGLWCARSWAGFDRASTVRQGIIRVVVGAVVVLAARYGVAGLAGLVIPELAHAFAKECLTTVAVMYFAPVAFIWVEGMLNGSHPEGRRPHKRQALDEA